MTGVVDQVSLALTHHERLQLEQLARSLVEQDSLENVFALLARSLLPLIDAGAMVLSRSKLQTTFALEPVLSYGDDEACPSSQAASTDQDAGLSALALAWRQKLSLVLTASDLQAMPRRGRNAAAGRSPEANAPHSPRLRVVMALDGNRQCVLSMGRRPDQADFSDRERAIGAWLMPFLCASLNRILLRRQADELGRIVGHAMVDRGAQAGVIAFDAALQLIYFDPAVSDVAHDLRERTPFLAETRAAIVADRREERLVVLPDGAAARRRLLIAVTDGGGAQPALLVRVDPVTALMPVEQRLTAFGLTPREIEVTLCLLDGQSNRAVSDRLGVAVTTVAKHVQQIMAKLSVRSRTQIAARLGEPVDFGVIAGADRLTARERAAVEALATGLDSAEAAASLHVSRGTYAHQLRTAARKLGVPGRQGLLPLLRGSRAPPADTGPDGPQVSVVTVTQPPTTLLRSLTDAVRIYGFHSSIFHSLIRNADGDALPVRPDWGLQDVENPALADWRTAYVRNRLYRGDPMFLASIDAVGPLVSALDFEAGRIFGDVERPLQLNELGLARHGARITGAHSGVAVPINNARGGKALIVFLSAAGGAQAAAGHRSVLGRLAELSASFHDAIRHSIPERPDPPPVLDGRETACLELLARGLTVQDVALELALPPRAIAALLASAGQKLGSVSRYQTLARAVAEGYIKPWPIERSATPEARPSSTMRSDRSA